MRQPASDLLDIYAKAVAAVQGAACVERCLAARPWRGAVHVVAVGKAAAAMLAGAQAALGSSLHAALLITKPGHAAPETARDARVTVIEAGHPLPDQRSLAAGAALLNFVAQAPPATPLLFLISGGASSLVEVLPPGVSLADLRRVNHWLLGSGLAIHAMNALRKQLSCIKGGRLATHLQGRPVLQLLISDVAGDAPADIGSGLLAPPPENAEPAPADLPKWLRELLHRAPPPPPADAPCFNSIETRVIANLDQALTAAAQAARERGYAVHAHADGLRGDAAAQGRRLAAELLQGPAGVHIWGGETTVVLPPRPGRGGRNQHLALAAALTLAGHDKVWLLAAGTDGSDGDGEDAGALVDGGTLARGELARLEAAECLRRADAGTFLEASGDLINTGPTGTNVMDLVIGLKEMTAQ